MKINSWVSGNFDVLDCKKGGKGAFANRHIRNGEVIGVHGGIVVNEAEFEKLKLTIGVEKLNVDHAMYIYPGILLLHDYINGCDPMCFINHSCEPNIHMANGIVMVASRDIQPGEEICWDYRITDNMGDWEYEFECGCGSPRCEGVVRVGPRFRKK